MRGRKLVRRHILVIRILNIKKESPNEGTETMFGILIFQLRLVV